MKYYLPIIALCIIAVSCSKPCEPSFTPFKPNFCLTANDIANLEGATPVPEDVVVYLLTKNDTTTYFILDDDMEFVIWQTWEFPIDSSGPDYIEQYFKYKDQYVICPQTESLENTIFYVRDSKTRLNFDCSVSTKNGKKMLFVIFEFPDLREQDN